MDRARHFLVVATLLFASRAQLACAEVQQAADDPFSWLEDLRSPRSLEWVAAHTNATLAELTKSPEYPRLYADIKRVFDSREIIDYPQIVGDRIYNLAQDETHPRGLWRRTTWDGYLNGTPQWESILDLDSLARQGTALNFVANQCIQPENRFCLLELARDGAESTELRELDIERKEFVAIGVSLPDAIPKARRLARAEMPNVDAAHPASGDQHLRTLLLAPHALRHHSTSDGDVYMVRDQVVVYLHQPWTLGAITWPAGSIIATSLADFVSVKRGFQLVMKPGPRETIVSVSPTRDYLLVNALDNVCGELRRYRYSKDRWIPEVLRAPQMGSLDVISASTETNKFFFTYTSFLQPTTLYLGDDGAGVREVKRLPATFSTAGLVAEQSEATSKDGTKIPFFVVHRSDMPRDRTNPTLLYAYGGFELSSSPGYGTAVGPAWIGRGGVYVVANIRGGGEFGPEWHSAGVRENRQRVYDDFTAVAEELIRQGITSASHLGIIGASNGGLVVGVALTQRPDLYKAAVIQSGLLDMRRYTQMLGGAHWIPEYGDPDNPEEWAYIAKYSPYQNLRIDTRYPAVLLEANLTDESVHPGHSRKMAARIEALGGSVYYFENAHGGHSSGLTSDEKARTSALAFSFLWQQLRGEP